MKVLSFVSHLVLLPILAQAITKCNRCGWKTVNGGAREDDKNLPLCEVDTPIPLGKFNATCSDDVSCCVSIHYVDTITVDQVNMTVEEGRHYCFNNATEIIDTNLTCDQVVSSSSRKHSYFYNITYGINLGSK